MRPKIITPNHDQIKLRWILEPDLLERLQDLYVPSLCFLPNGFSGSLFESVTILWWSSRIPAPTDPGANGSPDLKKQTPDDDPLRLTKVPMEPGPYGKAPGYLCPIFALS
jgi:hypothetical protein